jgi:hypothetical protein
MIFFEAYANESIAINLPGKDDLIPRSCSTFSLSGTPALNFHFGANKKIVDDKEIIVPNFAYEVLKFGNFPWV